jgi:DnaJ-class molecular chaperone
MTMRDLLVFRDVYASDDCRPCGGTGRAILVGVLPFGAILGAGRCPACLGNGVIFNVSMN